MRWTARQCHRWQWWSSPHKEASYLITKYNQMISLSLYGILKTPNYHLKWHTFAHDNPTDGLHSSGTPPTCLHSSGSILQPTLKYGDQTPPISSHCIFPNSGTIISVAMMTDITRAITARKNTDCFKDILYRRAVDKIILSILEHMVSSERRSKTLIVFFTTWKEIFNLCMFGWFVQFISPKVKTGLDNWAPK